MIFSLDQEDSNDNQIGDACDDGIDTDNDGVPDTHDNCPNIPNGDQLDSDDDGQGDVCDDDADNDGVLDQDDNCPIVYNPDQLDSNGDGVGDACTDDCDGDGVFDELDACPCNNGIDRTDFRAIQNISMGENSYSQEYPVWSFRDEGREIHQYLNSAPGVAIGDKKFSAIDFQGTIFIDTNKDGDWLGLVFAYQVLNIVLQSR